MFFEEFLLKIGIDTPKASVISAIVNTMNSAGRKLSTITNDMRKNLNDAINSSAELTEKAKQKFEKIDSKFAAFQSGLIDVSKVAVSVGSGISGAFVNAIKKTQELAKTNDGLFKITEDELTQIGQYDKQMSKAGKAIDSIEAKIAVGILPTIVDLIDEFNNWLEVNKELISDGISTVVLFLTIAIQVIANFIKFVDLVVTSTIGWKNALAILGIAWAVFNRQLLFSPIGLIIAGIGGLIFLIGDFITSLNGGKSVLGSFWDPLVNGVKGVISWWDNLDQNWKTAAFAIIGYLGLIASKMLMMKGIVAIVAGGKGLGVLSGKAMNMAKVMMSAFKIVGGGFKALATAMISNPIIAIIAAIALAAYLIYDNWDSIASFFSGLWDGIVSIVTTAVDIIIDIFNYLTDLIVAPFTAAWELVKSLFSIWTDDTTSLTDKFSNTFWAILDFIVAPFKAGWEFVKSLFSMWTDDSTSFTEKFSEIFLNITNFITEPIFKGIEWVKGKIFGLLNSIKKYIPNKVLSFFGVKTEEESADQDSLEQTLEQATAQTVSKHQLSVKDFRKGLDTSHAGSSVSSVSKNINTNQNVTVHNTMNVTSLQQGGEQLGGIFDSVTSQITKNSNTAMGYN